MAYLRWSQSPFYVFEHIESEDRGEPILAIYVHEMAGRYTEDEVRGLSEALSVWLAEIEHDRLLEAT